MIGFRSPLLLLNHPPILSPVKTSKLDRFKFIDVSQQEEHHSLVVDHHSQSIKDHVDALMETHMPLLKDFVTDISSSRSRSDLETFTGVLESFVPPNFKRSYPDELISGFINPVPFNVLPSALFDKDNGYPWFMMTAQKFKAVKGIMVNTFEELEPDAISGFSDRGSPPVYPVGPVLDINCKPYTELDLAQCKKVMKWLDEQPRSSLIFLCFGSFRHFLAPQVKEIALGLEQSGYRFLWSLQGFMERIQGKGIMIHGWAPQVKILAHEAIGGFVSHCGWNSILESLWFGVPVVTWPMYAEQQLNAFKMVKELGLAIELRLDYEELNVSNVVTANEIKNAVKQVMDDRSEVRKKAKGMAEIARKAIVNGGSPFLSIQRFIEDMIGEN
ncbi:hypothetical protein Gotur_028921 [Gossypium turneri]